VFFSQTTRIRHERLEKARGGRGKKPHNEPRDARARVMGASSSRSSSAAPRVSLATKRGRTPSTGAAGGACGLFRARGGAADVSAKEKKSSAPSALAPATAKSDGGVFSPSRSHPTVTTLISDLKRASGGRTASSTRSRAESHSPVRAHSCVAPFLTAPSSPSLPLAEHGVLDDLDDVAADVAARKVSLLNVPAPLLELPNAPHKTRNKSILRRNNTSAGETATGETSARPTARRLTWNDAKGVPGETLERVQIFDENDAMGTCSRIAPGLARRNSTGSTASFSSEESRAVSAYRVALAELPTAADDGRALVSSLDAEARDTVRRIGEQLAEYESARGATADLDPTDRRAKMLKRKLTASVASLVAERAAPRREGRDAETLREFHLGRSVTTAGDALLAYVVSESAELRRRTEAAERGSREREIVTLLARVDALSDAVPSRRVSSALRRLHRDKLALVDARARAAASRSAERFLRAVLREGGGGESGGGARVRGGAGGEEARARDDAGARTTRHDPPDTLAGAFFEVLALGGLIQRESAFR